MTKDLDRIEKRLDELAARVEELEKRLELLDDSPVYIFRSEEGKANGTQRKRLSSREIRREIRKSARLYGEEEAEREVSGG